MASVVGHGLSGMISGYLFRMPMESARKRRLVALCVLLAFLPDLDVLVYMVFRPMGMTPHRGFSHSLTFAFLATAVTYLLTVHHFRVEKGKLFLTYGCAALSAPLLDYFMGAGPAIPFFAPFWDEGFLFPIKVIPTAYYSTKLKSLISILWYPPAVKGYLLEVFLFLPILLFLAGRGSGRPRLQIIYLAISGVALLLSIIIYN
jgi:membrane-bound metal-dependent hydrolase YbcI (DUF457 family)